MDQIRGTLVEYYITLKIPWADYKSSEEPEMEDREAKAVESIVDHQSLLTPVTKVVSGIELPKENSSESKSIDVMGNIHAFF